MRLIKRLFCSFVDFPGHALHKKGLQRQIGVGTLVNSQQRRALAVPLINRWSTGRFVPPPFYIGFPLFVLAKRRSEQFFTVRWRARGAVGFKGHRNVGTLFCPASPRPAVRPAPCRPDPSFVCPGFGLDRCGKSSNSGPIRTDWVVNRLGWPPTPENLLSTAALLGKTAYSLWALNYVCRRRNS